MADHLEGIKRTRRLGTILLAACVIAGVVLAISVVAPFAMRKYSVAALAQGLDYYFVYDDGRGQEYVVSARVKKDRAVTSGYIERPVLDYREASFSEPLEKSHPEVVEKLKNAFAAVEEKALSYQEEYPDIRVVNCTVRSFTQEGITVSFDGIGIMEDGTYREIDESVDQPFGL